MFFFSIDNIYLIKFEEEQENHLQEFKEKKIKVNMYLFSPLLFFFSSNRFLYLKVKYHHHNLHLKKKK